MNINTFEEIDKQIGFRLITPTNFAEENHKLEAAINDGIIYNPIYIYPDTSHIEFSYLHKKLNALVFDNSIIGELYGKLSDEKIREIDMYSKIGKTEEFTNASRTLYGTPNDIMREECLSILNLKSHNEDLVYDANEVKVRFEEYLHQSNLTGWKVIVTDEIASKILVGEKKISINMGYHFSESDIKRLCVHEIGTHVLRSANGNRRDDPIYEYGTSGVMATEEGLAVFNEDKANLLSLHTIKLYAARYLCALHLHEKSLYELTIMIKDFIGINQAIYVASRMKVGLRDTSEYGGFYKDFIYLQGYFDIKNAVQSDPFIYEKLYYGRIALSDVERLNDTISYAIEANEIIFPRISNYTLLS